MTEPKDPSHLQVIEGGSEDDRPPIRTIKRARPCLHHHMTLDHEERTVRCEDCGANVEPFDAIAALGRNWDEATASLRHLRAEIRQHTAQLEVLKRSERNAKARARRARK